MNGMHHDIGKPFLETMLSGIVGISRTCTHSDKKDVMPVFVVVLSSVPLKDMLCYLISDLKR